MTDDVETRFRAMLSERANVPTFDGDPVLLLQGRLRRRVRRRNTLIAAATALSVAALSVAAASLASGRASIPAGPASSPTTPSPAPGSQSSPTTTVATGVEQPSAITDGAANLWVASGTSGQLVGIPPDGGTPIRLTVGRADASIVAMTGIDNRLYDIRTDTANLEVRDARTGNLITSQPTTAEVLTTDGISLWTTGCCGQPTPAQTIRELDPSSLKVTSQKVVAEEGEIPQLVAGGAGVWLLSEDGTNLRRIDPASPAVSIALTSSQPSADRLAVGPTTVALAGPDGALTVLDPATGATSWRVPITANASATAPSAIVIAGDDIYVAIPNHVLEYSATARAEIRDFPVSATLLSAGIHGVWATGKNTITQLSTQAVLPAIPSAITSSTDSSPPASSGSTGVPGGNLPTGYSFNSLASLPGQLLVAGMVSSDNATGPCVLASITANSGAVGTPRRVDCASPMSSGETVAPVVSYVAGTNNATIAIARTDQTTGRTTTGTVLMTFGDYSDTKPVIVYGGGSMWIYDVESTIGPEAIEISDTTGQLQDTIRMPKMIRPIAAANNDGLWLGTSINSYPGPAVLLHIEPGSHTVATVLPNSNTVVDWLFADNGHVWAGTRTPGPNDETLVRFDGPAAHQALHIAEPDLFTSTVVGSETDGLWTAEPVNPFTSNYLTSGAYQLDVIRIDPNTGKQTKEATVPASSLVAAQGGAQQGESAFFDGAFFLLDVTSDNTLARIHPKP